MWTDFVQFVTHAPLWFKIVGFALSWAKPVGIVCGVIGFVVGVLNYISGKVEGDLMGWDDIVIPFLIIAICLYLVLLLWAVLVLAVVVWLIANFFRSPDEEYEVTQLKVGR